MVKARTESSVTLGWSPPAQGDRPVAINGYLVEKRRLGAYTWTRCHEDEWVAMPELTVAGVAEEGEFQFRVSAVNSFGQSPYLEFPGTVHLGKCGRFCSPRHPGNSLVTGPFAPESLRPRVWPSFEEARVIHGSSLWRGAGPGSHAIEDTSVGRLGDPWGL